MPVNGFSFVSESFLSIIVQQPLRRACMSDFVQKKRGTVAPGWAFDLKRAERFPTKWLIQNGCGILCHAVGIVSENPRHVAFLKNLACFLQILRKKKSRALLDPVKTLMRASRDSRLPGPIGNRWRKPPRCEKRMHFWRSQSERKTANLRGFNPSFHPAQPIALRSARAVRPSLVKSETSTRRTQSRPRRLI